MLWNVPWWTLTFHVIWNIKTKHKTVDKMVLSLETSTCVQRLEGSSFSCDALREDVEPATFRAHTVSSRALMSFVHQQVGKCKISGFFGGGGRKYGRGLEGGAAVGRGILKLSNSSLVVLRKALPFSFPHFSDARPSTWKHSVPVECLTFLQARGGERTRACCSRVWTPDIQCGWKRVLWRLEGSWGGSSVELHLA